MSWRHVQFLISGGTFGSIIPHLLLFLLEPALLVNVLVANHSNERIEICEVTVSPLHTAMYRTCKPRYSPYVRLQYHIFPRTPRPSDDGHMCHPSMFKIMVDGQTPIMKVD